MILLSWWLFDCCSSQDTARLLILMAVAHIHCFTTRTILAGIWWDGPTPHFLVCRPRFQPIKNNIWSTAQSFHNRHLFFIKFGSFYVPHRQTDTQTNETDNIISFGFSYKSKCFFSVYLKNRQKFTRHQYLWCHDITWCCISQSWASCHLWMSIKNKWVVLYDKKKKSWSEWSASQWTSGTGQHCRYGGCKSINLFCWIQKQQHIGLAYS